MSEAQHKAQGIVGISLMVQIGDTPNPELRIITSTFNKVLYKGKNQQFKRLQIFILPSPFPPPTSFWLTSPCFAHLRMQISFELLNILHYALLHPPKKCVSGVLMCCCLVA